MVDPITSGILLLIGYGGTLGTTAANSNPNAEPPECPYLPHYRSRERKARDLLASQQQSTGYQAMLPPPTRAPAPSPAWPPHARAPAPSPHSMAHSPAGMDEIAVPKAKNGHYIVDCSLGNGIDFPAMIDTGATSCVINHRVAKALMRLAGRSSSLPPANTSVTTANGVVQASKITTNLVVEDIRIDGVTIMILHGAQGDSGEDQGNLIGMSLLSKLRGGFRFEPNGELVLAH
jgi:clan AA aspartic protease (TIGR02281 family)